MENISKIWSEGSPKKGLLTYGPLSLIYFAVCGYFAKSNPVSVEFIDDFSKVEDSRPNQQ